MIIIEKVGFLTTWQDDGRIGYGHWGVRPGGPMDPVSAQLARGLIHGTANLPVLESHFPGPVLRFDSAATISITGADFGARLSSGRFLAPRGCYQVQAGEVLTFTQKLEGEWVYIGIAGLDPLRSWLGSVDQPIKVGQMLSHQPIQLPEKKLGNWYRPFSSSIRFLPRPEFNEITFGFEVERLPESNRMGYRLKGSFPRLDHSEFSAGVVQGTIQLLPAGQAIVLMADHQTTGGYPVLGEVISVDIGKLAQKKQNQLFHLIPVSHQKVWEVKTQWMTVCRKMINLPLG